MFKWFINLKVGIKITLMAAIFLIMLTFIAIQGVISLNDSSRALETFYIDSYQPTRQLNRIVRDILQIRVNMVQEQLSAEHGDWKEVKLRAGMSKKLVKGYIKDKNAFLSTALTEEEKILVDNWVETMKAPAKTRGVFMDTLMKKDLIESRKLLDKWKGEFDTLFNATNKLINLQDRDAREIRKASIEESERTTTESIVILMIALIFGIGISIFITRSIAGPVRKGLEFAKKIAVGDFRERIDLDQKDELGMLGDELNKAADNLEELIGSVMSSAKNLVEVVEQIATGNQSMSQRTSEQASALEEIASTIEEANSSIVMNYENSVEAKNQTEDATNKAENGGAVASEAVTSINDLNLLTQKIEEITNVINEISFQTNLLALNAAVEAARAGDQGRGFAVVAGEVRNLAQRSGNAAKEIGVLVSDAVSKIGESTLKTNEAGDGLNLIIESVKNVSRRVAEISASSNEQKAGMEQITTAITDLDNMTQQNAAMVEETASASEEMSAQAQELQSMMTRFKIREGTMTMYSGVNKNNPNTPKKQEVIKQETLTKKYNTDKIESDMAKQGFEEF